MEERDGQHMGVVTKALVKVAPPCSMIFLVLFMTCREPNSTSWSSVSTRIILGLMFFRSCCTRPRNLWDRIVEQKPPRSSAPSTASSRAQQEFFIVLGPRLQSRKKCLGR